MKKSDIQVFLTSLLAAALLTCPASALSFPDVDGNSGDSTAIGHVRELGIMVGDTQGNFNPDKIVSRAEMATIVCRVLNQAENLPTSEVFTDVPITHWATRHIDEVGHYESSGTHMVRFNKCHCGFIVTSDDPNATEVWEEHYFNCGGRCIFGTKEVPNGEPQYVVDVQAHDESYCTICGAIQ